MEFHPARKHDVSKDQKKKYEKNDIDLAYKFASDVHKEFGVFLKAIVLFGSKATDPGKEGGDIDILLVVDDVTYSLTSDIVETYRVVVEKAIVNTSKRIHVTTLRFTSFWDYIRVGDPIGLNILRDGVALIDTGFFTPLQVLLFSGKVRPSRESMMAYFSRAPQALHNSKWHLLQASLDLYWACIDASHAAIMKLGELPPSPAEMPSVLKEKLVKPGYASKDIPKKMDMFYKLSKKILHKELKEISGKEYDDYYKQAKSFVDELKNFVKK